MAKVQKKNELAKKNSFMVVNPDAAGIDVSPKEMQVCVPEDRARDNNRRFGVYTKDLREITDWLKEVGVTTVAMESTGVYWIPIFSVLTEAGIDVILVNARIVKNYSGKKTDMSDAQWLMMLHRYGLLKPCFQPENKVRDFRRLVRSRDTLVKSAAREVQHVQKAMEQMNLKLDNVFSDILGKSGQSIIKAIIAGERDPKRLASLADRGCKKPREEIELSLQADWNDELVYEMSLYQDLYEFYQQKIREIDAKADAILDEICKAAPKAEGSLVRSRKKVNKKNSVSFDIEAQAYQIWGVNAMSIPGMSRISLMKLVGELGADFVEKFPDADHFASWANLVPNNKISGGCLLSSRVPRKKNPAGIIFRQIAFTLSRSQSAMGDYFRKVQSRSGYMQAVVATGRKLAVTLYTMVARKTEYDESEYQKRKERTLRESADKLRLRLEALENKISKTMQYSNL